MPDQAQSAPLTIADALALATLRRSLPEVVAGASNLGRPVRWVHVLDVDPTDLLRGGELVLSTGLGPGHEPASQRRFARALAEERAAGLLIELGLSYRRMLPPALVAEAEAVGLPLIATHRPVRFVDVTEAIHGALVDRRLALLRRAEETGRRLIALVLDGCGLPELLRETARILGNPVMLENVTGQLLAFAVHESSENELLEAREEHHLGKERGECSERGWMSVEIRSHGRDWGALTVLELDSPLAEEDRVALDRAGEAVALRLLHEETDEQVRARARGSFLTELTQGRLPERDAERRAAALGFPRRQGRLLPVALAWRSERWSELADAPDSAWTLLMPSLRSAIGIDRHALLGPAAGREGAGLDRLLILCSFPEGADEDARLEALAAELRRPLERRGLSCEDITIAFGSPAIDWTAAGRGLARVIDAVGAAHAAPPSAWHDARRIGVLDLLHQLRSSAQLSAFVLDQLGPLADPANQRDRELLRTLEVYIESGGSKAEAARLLHLERQSLYLRLERLERMLGVDLGDADVLLALHLALHALRTTQSQAPPQRLRLTAAS